MFSHWDLSHIDWEEWFIKVYISHSFILHSTGRTKVRPINPPTFCYTWKICLMTWMLTWERHVEVELSLLIIWEDMENLFDEVDFDMGKTHFRRIEPVNNLEIP